MKTLELAMVNGGTGLWSNIQISVFVCWSNSKSSNEYALSKDNLDTYFDLLQTVYIKYDSYSHPEAIYNMDKTGVPLEPRNQRWYHSEVKRKYVMVHQAQMPKLL